MNCSTNATSIRLWRNLQENCQTKLTPAAKTCSSILKPTTPKNYFKDYTMK